LGVTEAGARVERLAAREAALAACHVRRGRGPVAARERLRIRGAHEETPREIANPDLERGNLRRGRERRDEEAILDGRVPGLENEEVHEPGLGPVVERRHVAEGGKRL